MNAKVKPWESFGKNLSELKSFSDVIHTSHIESALKIIGDKHIVPAQVNCIAELKKRRTSVIWLSPNNWGGVGSRYGTVSFSFPLKNLLKDKNIYWVEVRRYNISACKILITKNNYSDVYEVYNPCIEKGPWIFDVASGVHYFNNSICLELMFEVDCNLAVGNISNFDFIQHNPVYCSIHPVAPKNCNELGKYPPHSCAKLISKAISRKIDISVIKKFIKNKPVIDAGFSDIIDKTTNKCNVIYAKKINPQDKESLALGYAIIHSYAESEINYAREIASLFFDEGHLISTLTKIMVKHLDYPDDHKFQLD